MFQEEKFRALTKNVEAKFGAKLDHPQTVEVPPPPAASLIRVS